MICNPHLKLNPFEGYLVQKAETPLKINDTFEHKYTPVGFDKFIGNKKAILMLKKWMENPDVITVITGPTGVGKTLLASLAFSKYNIVEFNDTVLYEKGAVYDNVRSIIKTNKLCEKKTAIIIEDIEKLIGDSFKKLLDIYDKNTPIICITPEIKKKTISSTFKINEIKLCYPEKNEMLDFCEMVASNEKLKIAKKGLEFIISHSKCDFRRILHTFKLLTLSNKRASITLKSISNVLKCSESDTNFSAYEIVDEFFNEPLDTNYCMEQYIGYCYSDSALIGELIYSNISNGLSLEDIVSINDSLCDSDIIDNFIFSNQEWELKQYSIIGSCISPMNTIARRLKPKKCTIKKNVLNNFPLACAKHRTMLYDICTNTTYSRLEKPDYYYIFDSIIKKDIETKLDEGVLKESDIIELKKQGISFDVYNKLRNVTFGETAVKAMTKKNKIELEKLFSASDELILKIKK